MEGLAHKGGKANLQVGKPVGLSRGGQGRQHPVVERVVVEQVGAGGADEGDDNGEVAAQGLGNDRDQQLCDGVGHARTLRAVEHAHEHAGAQHHHDHVDHVGGHRADDLPLGLLIGVVDQQGDGGAHAKENGGGGQAHHQGHDNGGGEDEVKEDQLGALPGGLLLRELHLGHNILHALGDAQALALFQAQIVADAYRVESAQYHAGDQRSQDLAGVQLHHRHDPGGGTAPGDQVHDAVLQDDESGQIDLLDMQPLIDGEHGGAADHDCSGSVPVQRDEGGQHGGAHQHLQRIALAPGHHLVHHGIEHARSEHDAEVEDGEGHHGKGAGYVFNAVHSITQGVPAISGQQAK